MVFRKYKPAKQWGKMDTRIFKEILSSRNNRKMPVFRVPPAVQALGVRVVDPNTPGFFSGDVVKKETSRVNSTFLQQESEDHPLYHDVRCYLFDGSHPMSDGVAQASVLSNAIVRESMPESVLHTHHNIEISEQAFKDAILHGEKFDPTLEKLPKRFDPVLFWIRHPRVHGTPVIKKNNIILHNIFRNVVLSSLHSGKLTERLRFDRDEPMSASVLSDSMFGENPFVLRFQPHLVVQSESPLTPWATEDEVAAYSAEPLADISPLSPLIDLSTDNVYNDDSVLPRPNCDLHLNTVLWSREQDQKYPWTMEQNGANAILHTFGAALAQANRKEDISMTNGALRKPVLVKGVQLVNGRVDLVAFQLNTLNLSANSTVKNVVWIEKGLRLYKPKPFYEELTAVEDLNMTTAHKLVSLLLSR